MKDWRPILGKKQLSIILNVGTDKQDIPVIDDLKFELDAYHATREKFFLLELQCKGFCASSRNYLQQGSMMTFLHEKDDNAKELCDLLYKDCVFDGVDRALSQHIETPLNDMKCHITKVEELLDKRSSRLTKCTT